MILYIIISILIFIYFSYYYIYHVKTGTTCNGRSTVARRRAPPVTIAGPLRTAAHHFPPKLPPYTMLTTFATFAVASRNFFPKHVHGLRIPLRQRPTRQPTHLVLVASMLQQHLSCIRPQRLYKPALRPSQLDRSELCRQFSIAFPLLMIALGPKVYLKTLTYHIYFNYSIYLYSI